MQTLFKRRQHTDSSFEKASRAVLSKHCPSENMAGSSSFLLPENRAHSSLFTICQCKALSGRHLWVCTQLVLPQPLPERQPWSDDYRENNFYRKTKTLKNLLRAPAALQSVLEGYHVREEQHLTYGSWFVLQKEHVMSCWIISSLSLCLGKSLSFWFPLVYPAVTVPMQRHGISFLTSILLEGWFFSFIRAHSRKTLDTGLNVPS